MQGVTAQADFTYRITSNTISIDYKLFDRWTKEGIHFVSRLKENADFGVWEDRPVPKGGNVTKDRLIRLNPFVAGAFCHEDLRLG